MKYKIGYKIKPKKITEDGVVIFTDGTNNISPSQKSCQAYGYQWNKSNATCVIRENSDDLSKKLNEKSNKIGGKRNKTGGYVESSVIYGSQNYLEGNNKNIIVNGNKNRVKGGVYNSSIISGDQNIVEVDVNNSSIISGEGAISIRDNETVVGGFYNDGSNKYTDSIPFTTQSSKIIMQAIVEDTGVAVDLKQGGELDYIILHPSSKMYLTAKCLYLGDGQTEATGIVIEQIISVDSSGVPTQLGQLNNGGLSTGASISAPPMFFVIDSNKLKVRCNGIINAKRIAVADISITEVIYRN
tara:strand:+ start:6585 stop:7481 length:897 start_codon:yes stop_codon:yes gene_type:complete